MKHHGDDISTRVSSYLHLCEHAKAAKAILLKVPSWVVDNFLASEGFVPEPNDLDGNLVGGESNGEHEAEKERGVVFSSVCSKRHLTRSIVDVNSIDQIMQVRLSRVEVGIGLRQLGLVGGTS